MKSQTTANVTKAEKSFSSQKERTPFRLDRNKSKYASEVDVKMKRSDLIGLSGSNSNATNYHDSYTKMKSNDSGYYDGYRNYGKENIYKSKYDPDELYSEISTSRENGSKRSQQQPYAGASTSRQIRSYKRTESSDKRRTAINLYEMLDDEDSEVEKRQQRRHQYTQRKSTGNQLRSDNQRRDFYEANEDQNDFEKTERENRRKEIESLIKKYAQMDDFYGRASGYNDNVEKDVNNNKTASKVDPWDPKTKHSPVVIPKKSANPLGKSQTMANIPNLYESNGYSSYYMSPYNSNVVPIKTNMTPSSSKSRMSKALSTFVRILTSTQSICCRFFLLLAVAFWRH